MTVLALVVVPVLLLVLGVPIFVVLIAAALGGIMLGTNPIQALHSSMFGALDIFPLLAVPLFIYAIAAQQSVPQLFLAGFPAGILIGIALAIYVVWYAKKKNIPITERPTWATIRASSKGASWAALAPIVIFGGIYGGLFTPTE